MTQADPRAALDALVVRYGESYAALSRMIGRNPAYLQQYARRGSPRHLPERERRLLADYFRVDEAVLGGPAAPSATAGGIAVPRIDVVASAGPGGLLDSDRAAGETIIDPALIRRLRLDPAHLSAITAEGESMLPSVMPGDTLLVDRRDQRLTARGGIYVLRADGVLRVKRVARHGSVVVVTSDTPAYPRVDAAEIDLVGRVVWLSRALG